MQQEMRRELGDGLILRRATAGDAPALAAFSADIHRERGAPEADEGIAAWTRDLVAGGHPTTKAEDFTVVEDGSGAVVSMLCLISQTWTYAGVPFGVGQVELVGTRPDYRGRGLVRAQIEVAHGWSAERGHLVQAIDGIPLFYRQFGYEMALDVEAGRVGCDADVPRLAQGQHESYGARAAGSGDLPFIADLYRNGQRRYLVSCRREEAIWRYELEGCSPASITKMELRIVQSAGGEPVGFLAHRPKLHESALTLAAYELRPGLSWAAVTPSVLRYLQDTGRQYARRDGGECGRHRFMLGGEHPCYQVAARWLPQVLRPYAYYVRVADLPAFLSLIRPVLEQRLAESALVGHAGELRVAFSRGGLRLVFEQGAMVTVKPWLPPGNSDEDAFFPNLTFLQLLFGHRSLPELQQAFPDCLVESDVAQAILEALFPRRASDVWALI